MLPFELFAKITYFALQFYSFLHLIAILFTWIDANPSSFFVRKVQNLTHPMWKYVEKHIPHSWSALAALISILFLYWLGMVLPGVIRFTGKLVTEMYGPGMYLSDVFSVMVLATLNTGDSILTFLMILCAVWFIISITSAPLNHPIVRSIFMIVDPVITPIQKILPRFKIDVSALVAAILFYLGFTATRFIGGVLITSFNSLVL